MGERYEAVEIDEAQTGVLTDLCKLGHLHFQSQVRKVITQHFQREKAEGREIWPARQQLPKDAVSESDMEICNGLACGG